MKTLWAYGCSWTYSREHEDIGLIFWPDIVSYSMGIDKIINRGFGGLSIGECSTNLMVDLSNIRKDDLVIFQFTYPERQCYIDVNSDSLWCGNELRHEDLSTKNITEKQSAYLNFILSYRTELMIREFTNINPIFNYIENNIGAVVKYWFLNIDPPNPTKKELKIIEDIVWNKKRGVLFPPIGKPNIFGSPLFESKPYKNNFTRDLEAGPMIMEDCLRVCDNVKKSSWVRYKKLLEASNDGHPDQRGQEMISKHILSSIDPRIRLKSPPTIDAELYGIKGGKTKFF